MKIKKTISDDEMCFKTLPTGEIKFCHFHKTGEVYINFCIDKNCCRFTMYEKPVRVSSIKNLRLRRTTDSEKKISVFKIDSIRMDYTTN